MLKMRIYFVICIIKQTSQNVRKKWMISQFIDSWESDTLRKTKNMLTYQEVLPIHMHGYHLLIWNSITPKKGLRRRIVSPHSKETLYFVEVRSEFQARTHTRNKWQQREWWVTIFAWNENANLRLRSKNWTHLNKFIRSESYAERLRAVNKIARMDVKGYITRDYSDLEPYHSISRH